MTVQGTARQSAVLVAILITMHGSIHAQTGGEVRAVRTSSPMVVDGRLSEAAWQNAEPVDLTLEVDPRENVPAPQRTQARVLYDDKMLYIGFVCLDTAMADLRASWADRDKIDPDDQVIVILDTEGDNQKAYVFMVNPRNIQADRLMAGGKEDPTFDIVWSSGAQIRKDGWSVEMGIPFRSLRFPDTPQQRWTILFGRQYPRSTMAILSASRYSRDNPCLTCQGLVLTGISGIHPGFHIGLLPYTLFSQRTALRDEEDQTTPFDRGRGELRAGLGVRVAPSPDLLFEGVLNPDFSQIESDAVQISVNTSFALFYPERRPFFLEGAELFKSGFQQFGDEAFQMVYSRTISDPVVAGKILGHTGKLSFAGIAARDRHTSLIVPGEEESDVVETGRASNVMIGRVKYAIGESYVGAMGSARIMDRGGEHEAGGVDWKLRFLGPYSFKGGVFASRTVEINDPSMFTTTRLYGQTGRSATLNGELLTGVAGRVELTREARVYGFSLTGEEIGPAFQSQNGFINQTDRRTGSFAHFVNFYPHSAILDRWSVFQFSGITVNHRGDQKEGYSGFGLEGTLTGQTNAFFGYIPYSEERYAGFWFPRTPKFFINGSSNPIAALSLKWNGQFGRFVYRDGTPPEVGEGHEFRVETIVRFSDRFRMRLTYDRARLAAIGRRELFYDGNVYQTLTVYQISDRASARLIMQYTTFDHRASVFPLFSYRVNPFTAFYLGATGAATDFDGKRRYITTSTQYFLKLQYLVET